MRFFAVQRVPGRSGAELARGGEGRGRERALASKAAEAVSGGRLRQGIFGTRVVGGLRIGEEVGVGTGRSWGRLFAGTLGWRFGDGQGGVDCLEGSHSGWCMHSRTMVGSGEQKVWWASVWLGGGLACGGRDIAERH